MFPLVFASISGLLVALVFVWVVRIRSRTRTLAERLCNHNTKSRLIEEAACNLSIVIPAFNESARIGRALRRLLECLSRSSIMRNKSEIIVVDDGSTDDTLVVAKRIYKDFARGSLDANTGDIDLRTVQLQRNSGKGAAVTRGILESGGKVILFMDSDGATDCCHIEHFCRFLERQDNAILCGIRNRQECKMSLFRRILSSSFALLSQLCVGSSAIPDTQCGFKGFTRNAARKVFLNNRLSGWAFDVELLVLARHQGIPLYTSAVKWTERTGSKLSIRKECLRMTIDMISMRVLYATKLWTVMNV